jgi:TetR/AcrR family transcriptional regulator, cholesterol catabolism regulator
MNVEKFPGTTVEKTPDADAPNGRTDKEHKILSAAAGLFARKGFENSSINEIGAACGLAKPTLYHYFRDKDSIYAGIVLTVLRELCEAVEDDVARVTGAAAKLHTYMLSHSRFFEERYAEYVAAQLGYRNLSLPADRRTALRYRDRHETNLRRIVEAGIAEGVFRPLDPATASRLVLSSLNWMVRWYKPQGPQRATEIAEAYYELILHGLAASTAMAESPAATPKKKLRSTGRAR